MDPELKRSMDNVLEMAKSRQLPGSTPESEQSSEQNRMEWEKQEQRQKLQEMRRKISLAGVPTRFLDVDVESIDKSTLALCSPEGRDGLFLHGPPGTGKTHLAIALLKDHGRMEWGSFVTVASLLMELRDSFRDKAERSEREIIEHYAKVQLLVLDDLGAEKTSEFALQSLYIIIDKRYSEMRSTIITSNLTVDEIAEKVGDRIASRIAGMCKVIELKGRDRRIS